MGTAGKVRSGFARPVRVGLGLAGSVSHGKARRVSVRFVKAGYIKGGRNGLPMEKWVPDLC